MSSIDGVSVSLSMTRYCRHCEGGRFSVSCMSAESTQLNHTARKQYPGLAPSPALSATLREPHEVFANLVEREALEILAV